MNFFLDSEFIEGFHKPLLGKRRHFIDLISIAFVCDDGREYYAISNEWNYKDASDWVKENIIHTLPLKLRKRESMSDFRKRCHLGDNYEGPWYEGKSNKHIALEIIDFVRQGTPVNNTSVLYGYFSAYDHVLLCSLFGTMIDLPPYFPMYTRDLKQIVDEWVDKSLPSLPNPSDSAYTFEQGLEILKAHPDYPKQTGEHNALADARWNYELYKFMKK